MRFTHTGTVGLVPSRDLPPHLGGKSKKCTKKQKFFRALKSAVNIQKTFLKKRVKLITSIHEGIIADYRENCNTFYKKILKIKNYFEKSRVLWE